MTGHADMINQLLETKRPFRGQLVRLERSADLRSATLELVLQPSDRPQADAQRWCIDAQGVLDFDLNSQEFQTIDLVARHPLLWTYDQDEVELYFQGQLADVHATIGRLEVANSTAGRGWIAFGALFNEATPLHVLLASGSGLLAKGPLPVITAYREVLEAAGLRCSPLNQGPMSLPGSNASPRALILGRSYVIAAEFGASEIPPDSAK